MADLVLYCDYIQTFRHLDHCVIRETGARDTMGSTLEKGGTKMAPSEEPFAHPQLSSRCGTVLVPFTKVVPLWRARVFFLNMIIIKGKSISTLLSGTVFSPLFFSIKGAIEFYSNIQGCLRK